MSEEEITVKKEEEIFGFKKGDLGALLGAGALLGVGLLAFHVLKPQLPGLPGQAQGQPAQPPQPAQPQPTQYTPEQIQQIQAQQQEAQAQQQAQQQPVQYGYATEQDPMSGKITRQRVREIESNDTGTDRFNSISV